MLAVPPSGWSPGVHLQPAGPRSSAAAWWPRDVVAQFLSILRGELEYTGAAVDNKVLR